MSLEEEMYSPVRLSDLHSKNGVKDMFKLMPGVEDDSRPLDYFVNNPHYNLQEHGAGDVIKRLLEYDLVEVGEIKKKKGENVNFYTLTEKGERVQDMIKTKEEVVMELNQQIVALMKLDRGEVRNGD